jgi:hypothetical protein
VRAQGDGPLFYALPAALGKKPSPDLVPLYEARNAQGQEQYSTTPPTPAGGAATSPQPVGACGEIPSLFSLSILKPVLAKGASTCTPKWRP